MHDELAAFMALGWLPVAPLGEWSVLAQWLCSCPELLPPGDPDELRANAKGPPRGGP